MNKKRKKIYSQIKGIDELQHQKRILAKKIKIRERLLNKHVNDFSEDFSGDYVYRQSVKALKLENALWKIAPQFLKGNGNKKNMIIPLLSGAAAAMASVFFYKNKNNSTENADSKAE